ncbi:neuroglian isoform X2 [Octopus sinensis]|uniref:Neuroglian isoform X2 n=1 Tax=Octopus sinensis TaxID=2607531 RepID=A0A7E6FRY2_9MOLL|nr:neuroglian isoform X2 [Octopus sinensis]
MKISPVSIFILVAVAGSVYSVTQPPLMTVYPPTLVPFKDSETVQLLCRATGEPQPTYTWKKDLQDFNPAGNDDRIVKLPNEGTLVFNRPEQKDVGMYQCFANNSHGTAMSVVFDLRRAYLQQYPNQDPIYYSRRPGAVLKLPCNKPSSFPDAKMMWVLKEKNGQFEGIDFSQRITMDHEDNLIFTNVLSSDGHKDIAYACMATNKFVRQNTQGRSNYLTVQDMQPEDYEPYLIIGTPNEMTFLKGQSVNLKCIFGGHPTPEVRWSRDGKPIQPDTRIKFASFGLELKIPSAEFVDAGNYECSAQATGSSFKPQHVIKVKIHSKPEWTMKPESIVTSAGSSASFFCNATSEPAIDKLMWFINGRKIEDLPNPNKFLVRKTNLTVINLTPQDAMTIQCNVSNIYGYVFTNVFLNVLAEAPELLEDTNMILKISEGQTVNITCKTTGYSSVQVFWSKDNKQITGGRYRTLSDGNLNIKNLVVADAGIFRCTASNKYGKVSATRTLIVRRKTRIEQRPFNLEANEGRDAKFTCAGTTDPMEVENLRIIWMKDGKAIATNEERMIQNNQDNSLTISGIMIRDAGRYTCMATNGLDSAKASAFLTVRARPEAPTKVEVLCYADYATVSWTSGSTNNAPIQFYIIQANTSFDRDQWSMVDKVPPSETRADIILSPYTNYTFRVVAQNKIGESKPSDHAPNMCKSKPDGTVPYQQPSNVHTRGDRKNYLTIMWTIMPPITHNGPDFKYVIEVRLRNSTDIPSIHTINNWQVNNISLLTNNIYKPYDIKMRVKNSIGDANKNPIEIVGYSGEDTPNTIVTNPRAGLIGATTAIITFDAVDPNSLLIRGKFNGYKIQYWKRNQKRSTFQDYSFYIDDIEDKSQTRKKRSVNSGEVTLQLKNVYPYSDIEAQVLVMNSYYVGPPSDVFSFKTEEGVPGPVPFLRAAVRGSNHFLLDWKVPDDKNGYIVGYDIGFQTVNGLNLGKLRDMEPQVTDASLTQIRLTGLRSSQLYRVFIWARTIIGKGDPYFIDVSTIQPSTPAVPTFSFVHIDVHYVNISWPESLKTDKHGSVYYIEYRKEESSDWQQTTDESVFSWKNVTNLEAGTDYEFRLVATNGKVTQASDIQVVTTYGHYVGFAGTSGWLYGMLVALLILVCIAIALYVLREKISERRRESYKKNMGDDEVEIFTARQINSFYNFVDRLPKLYGSKTYIENAPEFRDDKGYVNDGGHRYGTSVTDRLTKETSHDDSSIHKSRSNMSVTDGAPSPGKDQYLPPRYEDQPYSQTYDPNYDDYRHPNYENYSSDPAENIKGDQYYGDGAEGYYPEGTEGYYGDGYYDDGYYGNDYYGDDSNNYGTYDDGAYEDYQRKRQSGLSNTGANDVPLKFTSSSMNDDKKDDGSGGTGHNAMTTFV